MVWSAKQRKLCSEHSRGRYLRGSHIRALSIRASQRQRLRQFEGFYVQRYWALMDKLSLDALRGIPLETVRTSDQKAVRAYIRLCEDECELRVKGWIADATWSIWAEGMKISLPDTICGCLARRRRRRDSVQISSSAGSTGVVTQGVESNFRIED